MNKSSRVLQVIFTFLFLLLVVFAYIRSNIERNFPITGEITCDPKIDICFAREIEEEVLYYKIATLLASDIASCSLLETDCFSDFKCETENCEIIYCDEENVPEEESCTRPEEWSEPSPEIEIETDEEEGVIE